MAINFKKYITTSTCLASLVCSTLAVTACHGHTNVLLSSNKNDAAHFIYEAQNYAIQKTGLYDATSSSYVMCVKDPSYFNAPGKSDHFYQPCTKLFEAMMQYVVRVDKSDQNSKNKQKNEFSSVTLNDLKDSAVARRLESSIDALQASGMN